LDIQGKEEVNVKTEEEECIDIKHEDGVFIEEEEEEEENIDTTEDDVKEEVIYMSACLSLDPFQQYLETSDVFWLINLYLFI
jgi:hypothetical protein